MYEEFVERFIKRTAALQVGQPLDERTEVGPLISAGQRQRSLDYVTLGQEEGAQLVTGGVPADNAGYFLQPAIFTHVDNKMRIAQEEIFGPVVCVIPFGREMGMHAVQLYTEVKSVFFSQE
ncbi:MAG: aldehyde dehydrogenase family protein [Chloroflexi bacterium]|nr:MAG: aldehyde dehydrogenase family protein [Chloroflexota bacterium]